MKNLYLFYSILLLSSYFGYSQDLTNSNWYFGNYAGLNFNTNPPTTLVDSEMTTNEGCATISNKVTGALLFYTDGVNIWNSAHAKMVDAMAVPHVLTGHISSAQSAVIVPSPTDSDEYYIFTTPGNFAGNFAYSIVDMTLNSGLGNIKSMSKNIAMLNENGIPFTIKSEALTVAKNVNEENYWVLYCSNNKLYAYRLDSTGLTATPVVSDLSFENYPITGGAILSSLKVSPNNDKVAISFYQPDLQVNSELRVYVFNNSNGTVDADNDEIVTLLDYSVYSAEFSPNGNVLFVNNTQQTLSSPKLRVIDLVNLTSREESLVKDINMGALQRAVNNEIYIAIANHSQRNYLHKFNNQNDYLLSEIEFDALDLNPLSENNYSVFGLPQLVNILNPCIENLVLSRNEINAYYNYNVSNSITTNTNYTVNPNQDITLQAGTSIQMDPNSHIKSDAVFLAKIDECPTYESSRLKNNLKKQNRLIIKGDAPIIDKLKIYPNPASEIVTFSFTKKKIKAINVNAINGKLMMSELTDESNTFQFNVAGYQKGIYIITIETTDGEIVTEKLIKN